MAENKRDSFLVYCNWVDLFEDLSREDQGDLIMAIFNYVNNSEIPNFPKGSGIGVAFKSIKNQIDNNTKKYDEKCEINRRNAKKSHERTQANATERKRMVANGSEDIASVAKQSVRYPNDKTMIDNDKTMIDNEYDKTMTDNDASLLTEEQRFDLVGRSSVESVETYISKILKWEAETNKKCKDVYGTISKWIDQDKAKGRLKDDTPPSYDLNEYESFARSYDFSDCPWNAKEG